MSDTERAPEPRPMLAASRRKLFLLFGVAVLVLAVGGGAWWLLVGRNYESTDDAYVAGNVIQVTPRVAGTVVRVEADDTDRVKAGQTLVALDPADARVALDHAEAQLATAVRDVRSLYADTEQLRADVRQRQSDVARARSDLRRRLGLTHSGAVSAEDVQHARDNLQAAEAALSAAQQRLAANLAQTQGTTLSDHPKVLRAAAVVRKADLALQRTTLPAPVSGMVAQRTVQVGQQVAPGKPLMAVVPLNQVWVDANFKESQLSRMRVGQPVTLTADLYGGSVTYHGRVQGLGAGTGAAFALIPAQNATGNWIKVVQRLPVRIALAPKELRAHPLRIGLSMQVEVDVADRGGKKLSSTKLDPSPASNSTGVFDRQAHSADALVAQIITDNSGKRVELSQR